MILRLRVNRELIWLKLIYDSTAPWANGQFANGMHAAVANPFEQWFTLRLQDEELNEDPEVLVG